MKNTFFKGIFMSLKMGVLFSFCYHQILINNSTEEIIFIGHSYKWRLNKTEKSNKIDPRIEQLNLQKYSQIWLGGDLCGKTSKESATLDYLDGLFDLAAAKTHWAWGNHDINNGTPSLINKATNRKSFYSYTKDDLSLLVLNTNVYHKQAIYTYGESNCDMMNEQYELIKQVCDTIRKSKYLVILHHHCLATNNLIEKQTNVYKQFNLVGHKIKFACEPYGTFSTLVYPLLKKVQERGIQVILVGGDLGQRSKKFEYKSKDGIWFLGSGINNSIPAKSKPAYVTNRNPDSILIFKYTHPEHELSWEFQQLNSLIDE